MRGTSLLLLFGVSRTEKNKFSECASTLNFEIVFKLKVKSFREILIY